MLIRYNTLKIFISAAEAKPGGLIGAMLSPYLYSVNMNDFCKKFNEQSKEFSIGTWLSVVLFCDVSDRLFSFYIKPISLVMLSMDFFSISRKVSCIQIYDLVIYYSKLYKIALYESALVVFSCLYALRVSCSIILLSIDLKNKLY